MLENYQEVALEFRIGDLAPEFRASVIYFMSVQQASHRSTNIASVVDRRDNVPRSEVQIRSGNGATEPWK